MVLDINLKKKSEKADKTKLSQQMLVNTLLSEKQPTQPNTNVANTIAPVKEWNK